MLRRSPQKLRQRQAAPREIWPFRSKYADLQTQASESKAEFEIGHLARCHGRLAFHDAHKRRISSYRDCECGSTKHLHLHIPWSG